jgi:putative ABC transport system permease protein
MKQALNQILALIVLAFYRIIASLGSYLAIATGVLVATTTICGLIVYSESVNVSVLRDRLNQAHAEATYDLLIKGESDLMDTQRYQKLNSGIMSHVEDTVGLPIEKVGRHGWSKPLEIVPPGTSPVGKRNDLPRTRFQFYSNIESQIEIIDGTYPQIADDPQSIVEVMVTEKLAQTLNLKVGDEFNVEDFRGGAQSAHLRARLATIIRLKDPDSNFWFYAPWFLDEALTIPEESFFQAVALAVVPLGSEVTWAINYDATAVNISNVGKVLAGLDILKFTLQNQLEGLQLLTSLDSVLRDYRHSTFVLTALLVMLGAPVVGLALYYIFMSAELLVEYQRSEIAVLKSRGSNNNQVLGLFIIQGLMIVLPVTLLAPLLSTLVARLIGKAETFMVFTNPRWLPIYLRPAIFGYAALAGSLALLAIFIPTISATRQTIVSYRRETARSVRTFAVHRYFIDVALVILGALGYRMLNTNPTIITLNANGGLEFDPLLLLTPILLVAGLAFIALRFIPYLFRFFAGIGARTDDVSSLFALRQVARSPSRYNSLILILTYTLALGLFTTTIANAFDRNYMDQSMFATGADIKTHEFDYDTANWTVRPLEAYRQLPGAESVTPVKRVHLIGRQAQIIANGTLLGVDPQTFAGVAWWREDFTPPLSNLLEQLNTNRQGVLANANFIRNSGLKIGDTFDIDVDGKRVDFVLVGTLSNYFPTLYPEDRDRLVARLDYLQEATATIPSEIWIKTRPLQHDETINALLNTESEDLVVVEDGHQLAGVRKEDPLRTGLFGALSLGFIAASILSILGFLLYAYISIQSRSLQFGVLRATGLSTRQLINALSIEQLSLIALGLLLGTLLGGGAGWIFTRFLRVSIIAREAVPPFLVTTPWLTIFELYFIIMLIFTAALFFSVYLLRRLRVYAVLRLGEQ